MAPTNISIAKNGTGTMYGSKENITASKTSPAKIFPNNLNEKDIILAISEINSNIPIKNLSGLEKFKNFLRCVNNPSTTIPKKFVAKTASMANANVKFKSAAGDLNNGIFSLPSFKIKEPTPGSRPNQLETNIKTKMLATSGKYFSAASSDPKTDFIRFKNHSIITSTAPCTFPGTNLILLLKIIEKIIKTKDTINAKSRPFVMFQLPILNNCCAFNEISSTGFNN